MALVKEARFLYLDDASFDTSKTRDATLRPEILALANGGTHLAPDGNGAIVLPTTGDASISVDAATPTTDIVVDGASLAVVRLGPIPAPGRAGRTLTIYKNGPVDAHLIAPIQLVNGTDTEAVLRSGSALSSVHVLRSTSASRWRLYPDAPYGDSGPTTPPGGDTGPGSMNLAITRQQIDEGFDLTRTPTTPSSVRLSIPIGGPNAQNRAPGDGAYTLAGRRITWTPDSQSILEPGDAVTLTWS